MRKAFYILFCCFATAVLSAAEYTGRVIDSAGEPMMYATVFLEDDPIAGTATGRDGRFVLQTDLPTTSLVIVSFVGYEKETLPLAFFADSDAVVVLKEQPIALQETVVEAKKSKQKNKRKEMAKLLYQVFNRMEYDFPDEPYRLRLVSDVKMDAENTPWGMEQMIASVIQIPEGRPDSRDSVQFIGEYCKRFFLAHIRTRADSILAGKNLDKRVRQMALEMDSGVVVHQALWAIADVHYDFVSEMNDLRHWTVSRENEGETVLTYTEKKNFLGIVVYEILRHYIVDSETFRIRRFVVEGTMDVNIPFGHKLKPDELAMLNLLNVDEQAIDKFRVKSGHGRVVLNTIYRMHPDGHLYPQERSMLTDAVLNSTKRQNQTIPIHIKGTQHVSSVQTKGVVPLPYRPSRRVPREIVPVY